MKAARNIVALIVAALREIFDEAAYARFLRLRRLEASRGSYAAFLRDQEMVKARRPRCC